MQICTHVRGVPIDGPRFAPALAALAERDLAVWLHPVRGPDVADCPAERRSHHEIWWSFGRSYEPSAAMARLVFSGLFDRHPGLRIVTRHMAR